MNRVNLWQRIFSISSACLMAMLNRMELTEGSMRTRSDSLRETMRGWRSTSGDVLDGGESARYPREVGGGEGIEEEKKVKWVSGKRLGPMSGTQILR